MNPEELGKIQELLESLPNDIQVMEQGVSQVVLQEYYKRGTSLDDEAKEALLAQQEDWERLEMDELKSLLIALGMTADVKSYRKLEAILATKSEEIGKFGQVAQMYARMKLESRLTDTTSGFILSGLGGKGNKLRYYFVLMSKETITEAQGRLFEAEALDICQIGQAEIEEIEKQDRYFLIRILVPFEEAIGDVIADIAGQFPFLESEFICTNVEKPSHEFITKWMNDELEDKQGFIAS